MNEHALYKVMRSTPVNSAARRAVRQGDCSFDDSDLSREELQEMLIRMHRKTRLLKQVLGLDTKPKQKKFRALMNGTIKSGGGVFRAKANPRAAVEYIRLGQAVYAFGLRIAEMKRQETV